MNQYDRDRLKQLEKDVEEIRKDVKQLRAWSNKLDGGRTALLWLFGAIATVIGSLYAIVRMFYG